MAAARNHVMCAVHREVPAPYQCDGCGKTLCEQCIEESHRLLLCKLCGERALPLAADAPATSVERREASKPAAAGPYGIGKALLYPLRGSGPLLLVVSLLSAGLVTFLVKYSIFGCAAIALWLGWLSLLIGIQFKIVASTAKWENELPDWPEYFSLGERVVEILTFIVIALLNYGPLVAFLITFGDASLLTNPSLGFWLGAAAAYWVGTALSVMAWGGAALHWRRSALRLDHHLRALAATGGDGLKTVNVTFLLFGVVVIVKALLESQAPLIGALVGGVLGIYWTFVSPHLVGVLFRRHAAALQRIYES